MYLHIYKKCKTFNKNLCFLGTWLPELERWCTAFRPNSLMMVNTNNGTERLNEDLKYDELVEYKNCTLSDLLTVIVERFIPKLYEKYIELNVRFTSGYRKYHESVPSYMHNRPRWIVNDMVGKIGKISGYAVNIKAGSVANTFELESQCAWSKEKETYSVDFGSADRFSSCTCLSFRKYRVLCKHFFIIIEKGVRQFSDVSPLYRTHPFVILDDEVVTGTQQKYGSTFTQSLGLL